MVVLTQFREECHWKFLSYLIDTVDVAYLLYLSVEIPITNKSIT